LWVLVKSTRSCKKRPHFKNVELGGDGREAVPAF